MINKRCPNCNGSIIRLGHKEKPFLCPSCNEWFSNEEVTPKQTNADRIRSMTDEELADWLGIYCNGQTAHEVGKPCVSGMGSCEECWLDWLKQEVE